MMYLSTALVLLLFSSGVCNENKRDLSNSLFNHWVHSYEDDTKDTNVYRPSTYDFPLSMGRGGFEIKANGEFIQYKIAPADGLDKFIGNWEQIGDKKISIDFKNDNLKSQKLYIISVNDTILKVKI